MLPKVIHTFPVWGSVNANGSIVSFIPVSRESVRIFANSSSPYDRFYGPGHNGEIFTTKNGETYMIYHVHEGDYREDRNKRKSSPRMMNLQQIYWDDNGWPFFKHDEISGGRIRIR